MRTKPSLTLADVKKMLAACEAEAAKNNWAVAISIVDDGGFLLGAWTALRPFPPKYLSARRAPRP
jgi:uncharacterized protein GlcG (DUF336 family)